MSDGFNSTVESKKERSNILGVDVSVIDMERALNTIESWVNVRVSRYITVTPAHVVMDAYHDPALRHILNSSGLTTPDGMSIVWILRLLGHKKVERVYGSDLVVKTCQYGLHHNWRHFFYGGDAGVADTLAAHLVSEYPELQLAGTCTPPFRPLTPEEDAKIIETVNRSGADIVWVGLSSPKQEFWMAEHLGKISAPVMIGVGAAFDFVSGNKPQAPRWIQQSGFEWLFRLASEPKRLWPRYRQYPLFVWLVLLQLLGWKKFPAG
jgi:N-acetylglucosaminyldiphosphoundecaprenol N-acetyl-beta-D-mannosaminyltransferase